VRHETDSTIVASNIIFGDTIENDAGFKVFLHPGFEVKLGAEFDAYNDGCD